jgi:hypothetical protein
LQTKHTDSCACSAACRFCWLLASLLLLHRGDLLATFACADCKSLQPGLEPAADAQQQQQRSHWMLGQLKLTRQQQVRLWLVLGT